MATFQGTTGNNTLTGTTGADQLAGGAGNDVYIVNHTGDNVIEYVMQTTGQLSVLDTNSSGVVSNGFNNEVIGISTDFLKIIIKSDANNLVDNDTNNLADYFLKNLQTGAIIRINTNSNGTLLNGSIEYAETDWSASKLAFVSTATNTGFSSSNQAQIYIKDITSGQLSLVSASSNGTAANNANNANNLKLLEVSENGRYVLFQSDATNLVNSDTNNQTDLFVKDTQTGAITRINTTSSGGQTSENSSFPNYFWNASLSPDASKVLFSSYSPLFFNGDTINTADDFIKDLNTGTVIKLNNLDNTFDGGFFSWLDSTRVIATEYKLAPGGAITRLSIQDIETGAITQIDTAANGEAANGFSFEGGVGKGALSHLVFFSSNASNLVSGDTNNIFDLFMKNLNTGAITRINTTSTGTQSIAGADNPDLGDANQTGKTVYFCDISEDGTKVLFASGARNLVDNDTNNLIDLFIKDLNTGKVTLVTTGSQGQIATTDHEGYPFGFFTNPSGTQVYFESRANGLFTGDIADTFNVFSKQILDAPISVDTGGIDEVQSSITYTLGANLENLSLTGTATINGTGNALNNTIKGNTANNMLYGQSGDDSVSGFDGNDILYGGLGIDTLNGGAHHDSLYGDEQGDILSGGSGDDLLYGGSGGDQLTGGSGNDLLDGGSGADHMAGGSGNDIYVVSSSGDVITEGTDNGIDEVQSSINYTLGANLENLILRDNAVIGTGNALNNVIRGNTTLNDTLNGGDGNDTLYGSGGDDKLSGGGGDDLLYGGAGADTIAGGAGTDVIESGSGNDKIEGGSGDDRINTGSGDDIINAGSGLDTLDGGSGLDQMNGGTGNDTYLLKRGYGQDVIVDFDKTIGNTDSIQWDQNIRSAQLWFTQQNNDLVIQIIGTTDQVTIDNWYVSAEYQIEALKAGDGKILAAAQVQNLVSAMSSLTPPALGQTTLSSTQQNQLSSVLAQSWN